MKPPIDPESDRTLVEIRRKRLQLIPDPMELAKLAATLKPNLAAGTPEEQKIALASARSLFDLAVAVATMPTSSDLNWTAVDVFTFPVTPTPENSFSTNESGLAELRKYLQEENISPPKHFDTGRWGDFIKAHEKFHARLKRRFVLRIDVDKEVRRIKDLAAQQKKMLRRAASNNG